MTMVEHGGYMDGSPNDPIVDDDFEDILNFLDFPMENLEEDGVGVEWDSSESKFLGPIPTEALMSFPPMPQGNVRSGRVNAVANSRPTFFIMLLMIRVNNVFELGKIGNGQVNVMVDFYPPKNNMVYLSGKGKCFQCRIYNRRLGYDRLVAVSANESSLVEIACSQSQSSIMCYSECWTGLARYMSAIVYAGRDWPVLYYQIKFTEVQGTTGTFQTQSPVSVLEGSNSCSGGKSIPIKPIKHDTVIPVRPRSKRARPSAVNPWVLMAPISSTRVASKKICDAKKGKEKKRRLPILSGAKESTTCYVQQINDTVPQIPDVSKKKITSTQQSSFVKKCTHCEVTKTPQWREGPLGPKSLCNACGVRYRSGRLFPEYRPAASPTFVPSVHSNSHRKVVEMRKKSIYGGAVVEEPPKMIIGRKRKALPEPTIVDDPPMSPAPEFVPMSSYLFDVY
ncbi:hypothetical protein T459_28767 [Capsicum annuum]|uniref:GATA-type domain-containing protein n=1 Tax=Capsicum annuum TaxID=4072 RepID=A0A2G2YHT5_CAPAN|nr:hypothetical protein T459_28767 [Capsicum annuum]